MKTTHERFIPATKEVYILYQCDFCDFARERPIGPYNSWRISRCNGCGKDICPSHTHEFYDPLTECDDYAIPDVVSCPNCLDLVSHAWRHADFLAGRCDDLRKITLREIKELQKSVDNCEGLGYSSPICKYSCICIDDKGEENDTRTAIDSTA